jgi:hypothetical protein
MAHTVAFRVSLAASLRLTPEPFFSHKHFIAENKLLTCSAHLPRIYPGDGTSDVIAAHSFLPPRISREPRPEPAHRKLPNEAILGRNRRKPGNLPVP